MSADGKIFPPVNHIHPHPHNPSHLNNTTTPHSSDVKPFTDHFLANSTTNGSINHGLSALPRTPRSQPATRPSSPLNSRTPPPKRWKRSFDMAHGGSNGADDLTEENGLVPMEFRHANNYS